MVTSDVSRIGRAITPTRTSSVRASSEPGLGGPEDDYAAQQVADEQAAAVAHEDAPG